MHKDSIVLSFVLNYCLNFRIFRDSTETYLTNSGGFPFISEVSLVPISSGLMLVLTKMYFYQSKIRNLFYNNISTRRDGHIFLFQFYPIQRLENVFSFFYYYTEYCGYRFWEQEQSNLYCNKYKVHKSKYN